MIGVTLDHKTETHRRILDALRTRFRESAKIHKDRLTKWRKSEELFVGYVPAKTADSIRHTNRDNGAPEYTTIQLPYSYAVAMSAHSYWSSVFLARSPVFQYSGSSGEGEDQVLALETLINYQMYKARMLAPMYIWLQDAPKYGEAWLSNYWKQDTARVAEFVEEQEEYMPGILSGKTVKKKRIRSGVTYEGNAIANIHPGDVFTDPRYPRNRFQDGEFVAIRTTVAWWQLLEGKASGRFFNLDKLRNSKISESESIPEYSDSPDLSRPTPENLTSNQHKINVDVYPVFEFVVKAIPKEWGIGAGTLPEKWIFTVTQDFQLIIEARPFGHMHDKFPLALLEIEPEAYMNFSRSLVEIYGPVQDTLDWLVNSHFYNVRQVLNNQFIFDPSKVYESDIQDRNPGKAMRLKPAAYGTDVRTALHQFPAQDVTGAHMGDMRMLYELGSRLGVGDSVQGVQTPASRRNTTEIRGSQAFSVGRLKTIAEYFSCTGFTDLSSMMVSNSQQFYNQEKKLAIVGDAGLLAGERFLNVTPESIMGEYLFTPVDGMLPVDRYAQANLWRETITQMAAVPQVLQQYDLGKIFGYVAQLMGIKNLNRFRVEVVPDAQMLAQAAKGNSVPAGTMQDAGALAGMGMGV